VELSDRAARRRIQFRRKKNLFVEAGAGTGKTTALVARIVTLVTAGRRPLPMREIVAITFTEKAAAELKERLRKALEDLARDADAKGEDAERYRRPLREIEQASLQTIHAFVRSLLARYPLQAGLPPNFALMDDIQSSLWFDEWWIRLREDLANDPDLEDPWMAALDADVGPDRLRQLAQLLRRLPAEALSQPFGALAESEAELSKLDDLLELGRTLAEVHAAAPDRSNRFYEELLPTVAWVGDLDKLLRNAESVIVSDAIEILRNSPKKPNGLVGQRTPWRAQAAELSKEFHAFAGELRDSLEAGERLHAMAPLLERIRIATIEDADGRRRQGRIGFDDLLVLGASMLRNNPEIRERLRKRFACLLIDEFQDTDPLQVEIVMMLAAGNLEGNDFDWQEAEVPPGRLFCVGDPKQSIYRFRGADVGTYEEVRQTLEAQRLTLDTNFRSTPDVIEFVNETFGRMFGADPSQAHYHPLQTVFGAHADEVVVHTLGEPKTGDAATAEALGAAQGQDIAAIVAKAVREGWQVRTGASSFRPARFQDVTILVPSRTPLRFFERALEDAGIPFRVDSRSLLFETQQVRDLLNIVRAIEHPTDEVALLGSLRSPAFGCTDLDLFQHGGPWDYRRVTGSEGEEGRVVSAMRALRGYHRSRNDLRVAELLEGVVADRKLYELAVVQRRPRDHWRRISLLLEFARAYDASTGGTLRGFLQYVADLQERDMRVSEMVVQEADDDAVSLSTIHAVKGLEFPIVVLAGIGSSGAPPSAVRTVVDDDGRLQVRLDEKAFSSGFPSAWEEEVRRERREEDRLLYVAATRARDHLVVSLYHKAPKERKEGVPPHSMAGRLYEAMSPSDRVPSVLSAATQFDLPRPHMAPPEESREAWAARIEEGLRAAQPRPIRAPSALAKEVEEWLRTGEPPTRTRRPGPKRVGGTDLGRAVHTVLQTIDLSRPVGAHEAVIRAQAAAEGQDPEHVRRLVDRALRSGVVREAATSPFWREIFVSAHVAGVLVEGYIDLLFRRSDGTYCVVDFKTDDVQGASDVRRRMETYRYQAAAYGHVLEQTLGTVPSVRFLFLNADGAGEEVRDLPEAMQMTRDYLQWLAAGPVEDPVGEEDEEREAREVDSAGAV
jgi:ATP-dependent helicase/nuclease subunit A